MNSRFFGSSLLSDSKISVSPLKWSASPWLTTTQAISFGFSGLVPRYWPAR